MNSAAIKTHDVANGPGVRVSLFVSGCRNRCKGCFNEETWDFDYGQPFTDETVREILEYLNHDYIQGLSILGGEPFEPENVTELKDLVTLIGLLFPQKDVWIYSGYTLEEIRLRGEDATSLLCHTDVLVDGRFVESLKDITLQFRGSSNQRIWKRNGDHFERLV